MNHEILKSSVEEACGKIANNGIEGCDEKDIILACFGMLMFNGIDSLKKSINKAVWTIVGLSVSVLVSIILVLIFV